MRWVNSTGYLGLGWTTKALIINAKMSLAIITPQEARSAMTEVSREWYRRVLAGEDRPVLDRSLPSVNYAIVCCTLVALLNYFFSNDIIHRLGNEVHVTYSQMKLLGRSWVTRKTISENGLSCLVALEAAFSVSIGVLRCRRKSEHKSRVEANRSESLKV